MIEGHGNNGYKYGDKVKFDFSSNIAFNNRSKKVAEYLRDRVYAIENYPDPTANSLSHKIAKHHGVNSNSVIVCNGSVEAFYIVAHSIVRSCGEKNKRARSLIFIPSFSEYEDSCSLYNHSIEFASIEEFASIDYSHFDTVWIGTPNNPDGFRVSIKEIQRAALLYPTTQFIIDRAYNELSASADSCEGVITGNITLIYSLTKSFGIPGVRLGYIIASLEECHRLQSVRLPWSVNALSLIAGEYVMDNYHSLLFDSKELISESIFLQEELQKIDYLDVTPSDSNFFLCRILDGRRAAALQEYLIEQHNILVRDSSNFRGLTDCHFRVATQKREVNERLIIALKQWI